MRNGGEVARKQWNDLSARTRRLIIVGAVIDISLRIAALLDLRRRPTEQIRGSRRAWGIAIGLVNSAGLLPAGYLLRGRRRPGAPRG